MASTKSDVKEWKCCHKASHTFHLLPIQQQVFCWHGTVQNICNLLIRDLNVRPRVILNSNRSGCFSCWRLSWTKAKAEIFALRQRKSFPHTCSPARTCWCLHNRIRGAATVTGIAKLKFHCSCHLLSWTRSLGALRAPTSSWRPFGPLDFALRALRPSDPRRKIQIMQKYLGNIEVK